MATKRTTSKKAPPKPKAKPQTQPKVKAKKARGKVEVFHYFPDAETSREHDRNVVADVASTCILVGIAAFMGKLLFGGK